MGNRIGWLTFLAWVFCLVATPVWAQEKPSVDRSQAAEMVMNMIRVWRFSTTEESIDRRERHFESLRASRAPRCSDAISYRNEDSSDIREVTFTGRENIVFERNAERPTQAVWGQFFYLNFCGEEISEHVVFAVVNGGEILVVASRPADQVQRAPRSSSFASRSTIRPSTQTRNTPRWPPEPKPDEVVEAPEYVPEEVPSDHESIAPGDYLYPDDDYDPFD